MEIKLNKKVKANYLLEGFPGVGLVSTITTEYLINHQKFENIGEIIVEEVPPIAPIHSEKIIKPIAIYYNKEKKIALLHSVANVAGLEWKIKDVVLELAKQLKCDNIVSIEGVGNPAAETEETTPKTFVYTNNKNLLKNLKLSTPLREGIIMGVTGALLLNNENINHLCIFVDAHSNMPDSKASAEVIKVLNEYLKLGIDVTPLLKQAEIFEKKLQDIIGKASSAQKTREEKRLSYFG